MRSVTSVCMYNMYMYINLSLSVILLLSHWVKMLTVWFAKYSELYRQINTYFSFRVTWAPGPGILYYSMQSMHGAEKYYSVRICAAGFMCLYSHIGLCTWYVYNYMAKKLAVWGLTAWKSPIGLIYIYMSYMLVELNHQKWAYCDNQ